MNEHFCQLCSEELDDLRRFHDELRRGKDVFDFIARPGSARASTRAAVLNEFDRASTAQQLLREIGVQMKRRPRLALRLIAAAEKMASVLPDDDALPLLADLWRERSNAYRHVGKYEDALQAAELSAQVASRLRVSDYPLGQALYAAAAVLFKMTDYAAALSKVREAIRLLAPFQINLPYARCLVLLATIHVEQGDVELGQREYADVLPMLRQLNAPIETARVLANLADCQLRLGDYEEAAGNAMLAVDRYAGLQMEVEALRSTWTYHLAQLRLGRHDALENLHATAAAFELLGMLTDAGFVRLDITEEHLRRGDWDDAAAMARPLVQLFTRAGVTLAKVEALHQLRRAVENREATPELVASLRDYLSVEDPAHPFAARSSSEDV